MEGVREVYAEARLKFLHMLDILNKELQDILFLLDQDILCANGDIPSHEEMTEILAELNYRKKEITRDITFVKSQIDFVDSV